MHQNKYTVIFISFEKIIGFEFEQAFESIKTIISEIYFEFKEVFERQIKIKPHLKEKYDVLLNSRAKVNDLREIKMVTDSLKILINCINEITNRKVILLIDEYDAGFYESFKSDTPYDAQMFKFMSAFFRSTLQKSEAIFKVVLMGKFGIYESRVFSGIDRFQIDSILTNPFNKHFGFLRNEMESILHRYEKDDSILLAKIESSYGGYCVGNEIVINPSSVVSLVNNGWKFKDYWSMITPKDSLKEWIDNQLQRNSINVSLIKLLQNRKVSQNMEYVSYISPKSKQDGLWHFLLFSGYLTFVSVLAEKDNEIILKIPNNETRGFFEILVKERRLRFTPSTHSTIEQQQNPPLFNAGRQRLRRPGCTVS